MKLFLTKVRNLFDFKYCEDLEEDYNGDDDKEVVSVLLRLVPISHARTGGDKIWCFMVSRHSSDCNQADASRASGAGVCTGRDVSIYTQGFSMLGKWE